MKWLLKALLVVLVFLIAGKLALAQTYCANQEGRFLRCTNLNSSTLCDLAGGDCLWNGTSCMELSPRLECNILPTEQTCSDFPNTCYWYDSFLYYGACYATAGDPILQCSNLTTQQSCSWIPNCYWDSNSCKSFFGTAFTCNDLDARTACSGTNSCTWESIIDNLQVQVSFVNQTVPHRGTAQLKVALHNNDTISTLSGWQLKVLHDEFTFEYTTSSGALVERRGTYELWTLPELPPDAQHIIYSNYTMWKNGVLPIKIVLNNPAEQHTFSRLANVTVVEQPSELLFFSNINGTYDLAQDMAFTAGIKNNDSQTRSFHVQLGFNQSDFHTQRITPLPDYAEEGILRWNVTLDADEQFAVNITGYSYDGSDILFEITVNDTQTAQSYRERIVADVVVIPYCAPIDWDRELSCYDIANETICSTFSGCVWYYGCQKLIGDLHCQELAGKSACGAAPDVCYWTQDGRSDPPSCEIKDAGQPLTCEAISTPDICIAQLGSHCAWSGGSCITLANGVSCTLLDDYTSCMQGAGLCYWNGQPPTAAFDISQVKDKLTIRVNASTTINVTIQNLELFSKVVNVTYRFSNSSLSLVSYEGTPSLVTNDSVHYTNVNMNSLLKYSFVLKGFTNTTYESVVIVTYAGRNYTNGMQGKVENPIYPKAVINSEGLRVFNNTYYLRGTIPITGNATGQEFSSWRLLLVDSAGERELCNGRSVLVGTFCLIDTKTIQNESSSYKLQLIAKNLDGNNDTAELSPILMDNTEPLVSNITLAASSHNPNYAEVSDKTINVTTNFSDKNLLRIGHYFTDTTGNVLHYTDKYVPEANITLNSSWNAVEYTLGGQQVSATRRNNSILVPGLLRSNATAAFRRYDENFSQWYLAYNSTGAFLGVTQDAWCAAQCIINDSYTPHTAQFKPYRYVVAAKSIGTLELSQIQLYPLGDTQNPSLLARNSSQIGSVSAVGEDGAGGQNATSATIPLDNLPPTYNTLDTTPVLNTYASTLAASARFSDSDIAIAFVNTSALGVPQCPTNITLLWNTTAAAWQGSCDVASHISTLGGISDMLLPGVACDTSKNCRLRYVNLTLIGAVSSTAPSCYRVDTAASTNLSVVPSFSLFNYTIALQANKSCLHIGPENNYAESHRVVLRNIQGGQRAALEQLVDLRRLLALSPKNKTMDAEPYVAFNTSFGLPVEQVEVTVHDLPYLGKPAVDVPDRGVEINPDSISWTSQYSAASDMFYGRINFNASLLGNFSIEDRQAPLTNTTIRLSSYGTTGSGIFQKTGNFSLPLTSEDLHSAIKKVYLEVTNQSGFSLQRNSSETNTSLCVFANVTAHCEFSWSTSVEGVYSAWVNITDYAGETLRYRLYFIYDNTSPRLVNSSIADIGYVPTSFIPYNLTVSEQQVMYDNTTIFVYNTSGNLVATSLTRNVTASSNVSLPWMEGNYTLVLRMADRSGNRNETNKTLIVDMTPPQAALGQSSMGPGHHASDYLFINISQAEPYPASIILSLYNQQYILLHQVGCAESSCAFNRTALAEGTYSVVAALADKAGNWNSTEIVGITLDLTAPKILLFYSAPSSGATYDEQRVYDFTIQTDGLNDTATLILDNIPYDAPRLSGSYYRAAPVGIAAGNHTYYWSVQDLAGNTKISSNFTYTIQRAIPQLGINASQSYGYDDPYTISGLGCPAQISCVFLVDGALQQNSTIRRLDAGNHTIIYRTEGNENYTAAEIARNISIAKADNSLLLTVNTVQGNRTYWRPGTHTINATALAGGSITLSINGSVVGAGTDSVIVTQALGEDRTYAVRATVEQTANHYPANGLTEIVIDSVPPALAVNVSPGKKFNSTQPSIAFSVAEQHFFRAEATLSNASASYNSTSTNQTGAMQFFGVHSADYDLQVIAYDLAGNNHTVLVRNISFDTEAPKVSVTGRQQGATYYTKDTTLSFSYNISDEHLNRTRVEIRADNQLILEREDALLSGSINLSGLMVANYSAKVIGIDEYGNRGEFSFHTVIDYIPPAVLVYEPQNDSEGGGNAIVLRYDVTDRFYNYSRATLYTRNGTYVSDAYSYVRNNTVVFPVPVPTEGYYNVDVTVFDMLENSVNFSASNIYREWTPPTVTMEKLPASSTHATHNLSCYAQDAFGISSIAFELRNSTDLVLREEQNLSQHGVVKAAVMIALPAEEEYVITCLAADGHGNIGRSENQTMLYSQDPLRIAALAAALDYTVLIMDQDTTLSSNLFANVFLPNRFRGANITWSSADGSKMYTDPLLHRGVRSTTRGSVRLTANISLPHASVLKDYTFVVSDPVTITYALTNGTYAFKGGRRAIAPTRQLLDTNATYSTTEQGHYYLDLAYYPLIEYSPTATRLKLTNNATMRISAQRNTTRFEVDIPRQTEIVSTSYWNGLFKLPEQVPKSFNYTESFTFELGSGAPMNLSQEVEITVVGMQRMDHAAWIDFEGVPHEIPSCAARGDAPDCFEHTAEGVRLRTRHLTLFVLYRQSAPVVNTGGGGGGGGGGGAGGGGGGGGGMILPPKKEAEKNITTSFTPQIYYLEDMLSIREKIGVPFIVVVNGTNHTVIYQLLSGSIAATVDGRRYDVREAWYSESTFDISDCTYDDAQHAGECDFSIVRELVAVLPEDEEAPPGRLEQLFAGIGHQYDRLADAIASWLSTDGKTVLPTMAGASVALLLLGHVGRSWYRKNRVMLRMEMAFWRMGWRQPRSAAKGSSGSAEAQQSAKDRQARRKEISERLERVQDISKP